jgi:hypothetical protein
MDPLEPNTSGQGSLSVIPPGVDRWNWGAFMLNWIWGVCNNTWISLLMFVPGVNFIMLFILGAKGSVWAWRNRQWDSVAHFQRVQRRWALGGLAAWLGMAVLVAAIVFGIFMAMKNSDVYKGAASRVQASQEAIEVLGPPITTGIPSGSFNVSGGTGTADLSFGVSGSKAAGTVYLKGEMEHGHWHFRQLELEVQGRAGRIDLDPGT